MADKIDHGLVAYVLGISSIVLAFFSPLIGLVMGIVGILQVKKQNDSSAKKGRQMSKIGIILNIVVIVVGIVSIYVLKTYFPQIFAQALI